MTRKYMPEDANTSEAVTRLLLAWRRDHDREAFDQLIPLVYDELRRIARAIARRNEDHPEHATLNPTAMVQQAYLNLINQHSVEWEDRAHFFAVAAREMRRLLVDYGRYKNAEMRGGGQTKVHFSQIQIAVPGVDPDALAVNEALTRLEALDAQQARIIDLRFFGGMTVDEANYRNRRLAYDSSRTSLQSTGFVCRSPGARG